MLNGKSEPPLCVLPLYNREEECVASSGIMRNGKHRSSSSSFASANGGDTERTPLVEGNARGPLASTTASAARSGSNRRSIFIAAVALLVIFLMAVITSCASSMWSSMPKLKVSFASTTVELGASDVLRWFVSFSSLAIAAASYCASRTNLEALQRHSNAIAALQTKEHAPDRGHHPDAESCTNANKQRRTQQQRAMLSLAVSVCNYCDLFVMCNHQMRLQGTGSNSKHSNPHAFLFSALRAATLHMLDALNDAFAAGLVSEITNSHPDAREQFTVYHARLLDAASSPSAPTPSSSTLSYHGHSNHSNHSGSDKWAKRDIVEGNERLLVQAMSYLTGNSDCIGGEASVGPVLERIDGLLDVHLRLLEQHQQG